MKNYSNVIICPKGKGFGTAKSHGHAVTSGYNWASEEAQDEWIEANGGRVLHDEVDPKTWALWALNAKSIYVDVGDFGIFGGTFGNHTLWRSSVPRYAQEELPDTEVGEENPAAFFSPDGKVFPKEKGFLPFVAMPFIYTANFEDNSEPAPAPDSGNHTPYYGFSCYILDDKFYVAMVGGNDSFSDTGFTVEGKTATFSFTLTANNTQYSVIWKILTTFYDS